MRRLHHIIVRQRYESVHLELYNSQNENILIVCKTESVAEAILSEILATGQYSGQYKVIRKRPPRMTPMRRAVLALRNAQDAHLVWSKERLYSDGRGDKFTYRLAYDEPNKMIVEMSLRSGLRDEYHYLVGIPRHDDAQLLPRIHAESVDVTTRLFMRITDEFWTNVAITESNANQ